MDPVAADPAAVEAPTLLDPPAATPDATAIGGLAGELGPAPRPAWRTVALALTGVLPLLAVGRLVGRLALGLRRPAILTCTAEGLTLRFETLVLGRVLRRGEQFVPHAGIAVVQREERFARAGLYVGLAALALGSWVGVSWLVEGVRVPGTSPSLLGLGLLAIALGALVDYGLSGLTDSVRGQTWIVVHPRAGRPFAVRGVDPAEADAVVRALMASAPRAS